MLPERFRVAVSVNVIFEKEGKVLLLRRAGTGWADGSYTLPAGHINGNEKLRAAAVRESREEVGVDIEAEDLQLVHVMHRSDKEDDQERLDFYFTVNRWNGDPYVAEPHKSDELDWFLLDALPEKILKNAKLVLQLYKDELLSEVNW